VGDTLYLRGGVYDTSAMTAVHSSGVTDCPMMYLGATTVDSPTTTIMSYPGEWAILDGNNTTPILQGRFGARQYNILFQNFEVRNGFGIEGSGLAFGDGPNGVWLVNSTFRNLYIHNNGHTASNDNPAGLHLSGEGCTVEYCTFENNGLKNADGTMATPYMHNEANLCLYLQYGTAGPIDSAPRRNNIIQYNRFIGSFCGIKDKGSGDFIDVTVGDTLTDRYNNALLPAHRTDGLGTDWSTEIRYNVFIDARQGYYHEQDLIKVHHNIFSGCTTAIKSDQVGDTSGATYPKLIWEAQFYNNTHVNGGRFLDLAGTHYTYANGGYNFELYNNLIIGHTSSAYSWFNVWYNAEYREWPMVEDHNGYDISTLQSIGYYSGSYQNLTQWQALVNPRTGTTTLGVDSKYQAYTVDDDYIPSGTDVATQGRGSTYLGAVNPSASSWVSTVGYSLNGATPPAVDGVCGSSDGGTFTSTPATNLCEDNSTPEVTLNNTTYSWTCLGSDGGDPDPCSATYQAPVVAVPLNAIKASGTFSVKN
jgi:hypothetical protein